MRILKSKLTGEIQAEGKEQFPRKDPTVKHRRADGRFRLGLTDPFSKCVLSIIVGGLRKWTMDTDGLDWNLSSTWEHDFRQLA